MVIRKFSTQVLFFLLLLFTSFTTYAASQQECCAYFYQGLFLPLACGQYLGGSVLTFPERVIMRLPPPPCNVSMNILSIMATQTPVMPAMRGIPLMIYGYPMIR